MSIMRPWQPVANVFVLPKRREEQEEATLSHARRNQEIRQSPLVQISTRIHFQFINFNRFGSIIQSNEKKFLFNFDPDLDLNT